MQTDAQARGTGGSLGVPFTEDSHAPATIFLEQGVRFSNPALSDEFLPRDSPSFRGSPGTPLIWRQPGDGPARFHGPLLVHGFPVIGPLDLCPQRQHFFVQLDCFVVPVGFL
jgi:hypothetical protein